MAHINRPRPARYFFFNDTATTEIYTLSLHDALPIWTRPLARTIRARAEAALRRAKTDAGTAVGASALDEATFSLRTMGLTWREIGILREMEQLSREGKRLDRASLAARLGVSPNTLRVHLTRIRAKLDIAEKRGDEVLLQAALTQKPA